MVNDGGRWRPEEADSEAENDEEVAEPVDAVPRGSNCEEEVHQDLEAEKGPFLAEKALTQRPGIPKP